MRRGDGAQFDQLYRLHYARAARFAHLMTGGREGEDLAQEAFLRAFKKWDPDSPPEAFWSWLQTTLLRLHLNALRRAGREIKVLARVGPAVEEYEPEPADDELLAALRSLPPRQRAAVVLRYYEDLPEAAVAERLGCRLGTAKALLHQARQRLKIAIEEAAE